MSFQYTTKAQIRESFWEAHPQFRRKGKQTQNQYPTDTRCAFVDYID